MLRSRIRLVMSLLAVSLAAVALAACGGSGGSGSPSGGSDEEKRLAFEDCLRDEGLDVETTSDGRSTIRMTSRGGRGGASLGDPDDENGPFARCREKTGWAPSPPSEEAQAEMRDEALKFARCMREHGADVPDPAPDGRLLVRVEPGDEATMKAAQAACDRLMPSGPHREVGGGGSSAAAP